MIITEAYKSEILTDTKLLLNITDNSSDDILTYIAEDTINMVLSYCRLETLPKALYGLIPQIVVQAYGMRNNLSGVSAITEGDRKIEYRNQEILSDYYSRLKPFVNIKAKLPSEVSAHEE